MDLLMLYHARYEIVHFNGTQKDTDGHRFYFNVPMNNMAMC